MITPRNLTHILLLTCSVLSIATSGVIPQTAWGEINPATLSKGMSQRELLGLYGSPTDKEEFESRREELWSYGPVSIRFFEGRVVSWGDNKELKGRGYKKVDSQDTADTESAKMRKTTVKPVEQATIDQILSEIMQAAPDSGSESDGTSSGTTAMPGRPTGIMEPPGVPMGMNPPQYNGDMPQIPPVFTE